MSSYDYKLGKDRVENILDNMMIIEDKEKVPSDDNFTFENGYRSYVTAIFVDIRDSTTLFTKKTENTAKLIRSFTSEIIEILRDDDNLRSIGIRGDCVFAIYTTPYQIDIYECADKTFYINTFIKMLNKLLEERGYSKLKAGIGMATDKELVIKAGRKGVSINDKVWIGEAVTVASKLSSYGDKNGKNRIFYSEISYNNFIDELEKRNSRAKEWFQYEYLIGAYSANIIKTDFNNWIDGGFSD